MRLTPKPSRTRKGTRSGARLTLTAHDQVLVDRIIAAMRRAVRMADQPATVARRLTVVAVRLRNRGRAAAKRHPFRGVCEKSGRPLRYEDAVLDELESAKGYAGRVQWLCPFHNNSGRQSCGGSTRDSRARRRT